MSATILLADDDDDDYLLFSEAISQILSDYEMHRVKDGLECIYVLKHFKIPNYIFLDLNMPLKNGIECLKAIRLNPELAEVPVIIFSSTHHLKDIDLSYKFGATYYLVKPQSFPATVKILKRLFLLLSTPGFIPLGKAYFVVRHNQKEGSQS